MARIARAAYSGCHDCIFAVNARGRHVGGWGAERGPCVVVVRSTIHGIVCAVHSSSGQAATIVASPNAKIGLEARVA